MGESRVTPVTLFAFLFGRADAIRTIAASRGALGLGAAFVAAAALAREYDRRDLLAEGSHLALPFVASLALSFAQFLLFWPRRSLESTATFVGAYRAFLTCFWTTAPLALLYAIPYERFLGERAAVDANLNTLTVVSLWRGLVTCRVLQVLAGVSFPHALLVSLLLADVVVLIALDVLPVPVFDVMAGLAQTPAVRATAERAFLFRVGGFFALFVLVPAALFFVAIRRPTWRIDRDASPRVSPFAWAIAVVAIVDLASLLPITQPSLRLAHRADALMADDQIDGALRALNAHPRDAFPPGWRPLPIVGLPVRQPTLIDVAERAVATLPPEAWPRAYFVDEAARYELSMRRYVDPDAAGWPRFETFLATLAAGERERINAEHRDTIDWMRRDFECSTTRSADE